MGRKKFGGGRHLGEERFNWTRRGKTFGGGKHLGEEDIWVRKDLMDENIWGRKTFGGGKI